MTTNQEPDGPKNEYDPYEGLELFEDYDVEHVDRHHQKLVQRLAKPGDDIVNQMTPSEAHLLHMAVGVAGEAGELLDCIKKHVIYKQDLDEKNVVEEIGDLQFYIQGILNELQLNPSLTRMHNIIKLEKRYGETYSDEAAQERADKQ